MIVNKIGHISFGHRLERKHEARTGTNSYGEASGEDLAGESEVEGYDEAEEHKEEKPHELNQLRRPRPDRSEHDRQVRHLAVAAGCSGQAQVRRIANEMHPQDTENPNVVYQPSLECNSTATNRRHATQL